MGKIDRSSWDKQGNHYWRTNKVSGIELYAMRMMRKKSIRHMAKLIGEEAWYLEDIEKNARVAPTYVVALYMQKLGITPSHMEQFKKIIKGELKQFTESRTITAAVKREVRKRYGNKCAKCGATKNLHFHHIERFADGGQNSPENLTLLCAKCHAEEHKDEKAYHALKKMADSAGDGQ